MKNVECNNSSQEIDNRFKNEILRKEIFKLIKNWAYFDSSQKYRAEYIDIVFPNVMNYKKGKAEEYEIVKKINNLLNDLALSHCDASEILTKSVDYTYNERLQYISEIEEKERLANLTSEEKERIRQKNEQELIEKNKKAILNKIIELFNQYKILEASNFYHSNPIISYPEFIDLKTVAIKDWFKINVLDEEGKPFILDEEQARAVIEENDNILVSARAGSGKTRVIVARIIYLVEILKERLSSIKVFAFNKSTPIEINSRLNKIKVNNIVFTNKEVCQTFHSFANSVIRLSKPPLILAEDKELYIQKIIEDRKLKDINFSHKVYTFFRSESFKVDKTQFANEEHYYNYLKNSKYSTLDGKNVKSVGEKYIADFLFEHGIKYTYEKSFYPNKIDIESLTMNEDEKERCRKFLKDKKETKPDFFLNDFNVVWENWAISGKESTEEKIEITESGAIGDYDDYSTNQKWKKDFWSSWRSKIKGVEKYEVAIKNVKNLIQTTKLNVSREEFEKQIESELNKVGIKVYKRNHDDIVNEVWQIALKKFSKMVTSYINRYQQKYLDSSDIYLGKKQLFKDNERVNLFINIGEDVYLNYLKSLGNESIIVNNEPYNKDFNMIVDDAANILGSTKIPGLSNIKHILIDEYQDFSNLFFKFIKAMRNQSLKSQLFCVGDDWQLINRFAGSDEYYFNKFKEVFPNGSNLNILTNYRSNKNIVAASNSFMKNFFKAPSSISSKKDNGEVNLIDVNKDYLSEDDEVANACLNLYDNNYDKARYLNRLIEIVKANKESSFLILHRSNDFKYDKLKILQNNLRRLLIKYKILEEEQIANNITFETIHRSKGMQADIVVIIEANEGIIPMYHPDNVLFEIFGESAESNFYDQVRLFYVAITRAKNKLFVLYEEKNKSSFLKLMNT
ncbi:MAG: UvrD-helicase domain-containing protein [Clostridia bacterium]|nr:UvrD-helicase domain-containing protein [Clostridia bacterium]